MIVDASAVLAILLDEPEAAAFAEAIANAEAPRIAAPNWLEVAMKLETMLRDGAAAGAAADSRLAEYTSGDLLTVVPFTGAQARLARDAYRRYGKGRDKAGLNFGDCIAYAVAKSEGAALLFKGNDFALTDIEPALRA
jgi:ribonuclease VapC